MAMRLGFESLPMELFLAVVANLDIPDQLALGQCRREYHVVIERDLFRVETLRDLAMRHAIANLNIHLIKRLLVLHNASPTVFFIINKPYEILRGFIATNTGIFVLARFRNKRDVFPTRRTSETTVGIGELTLHALAKVDTAKMDAGQRQTYIDMWRLFLDYGARLNVVNCYQSIANLSTYLQQMYPPGKRTRRDEHLAYTEHSASFGRRKTRELFRRIMGKPSWNAELADVKAKLIRIYYEIIRGIAVADLHISPTSRFQQIPRHIHTAYDTVVIEAILDGEQELDRASHLPPDGSGSLPLAWRSIPLVDRPVQRGQRGELVSPLSAAILNDNRAVFDLLLRRGANINGVEVVYRRHSPKKYALHIPIFAAAWLAARDFTTGFRWILLCLEKGASPNPLCLGRLNGDFFIEAGLKTPGHQGFFHWITPLDVYLATIPKKHLRRRMRTLGDSEAAAHAESEPELRKIRELVHVGFRVDWTACQPITYLLAPPPRIGHDPMASVHMCGRAQSHSGYSCSWYGFHRCQSPSAAEIIIDRFGFAALKDNVALGLAQLLMTTYSSGRSCFSRMLFRYERDMQRLAYQEGSEADPSLPMANVLFGCMSSFGWDGRDFGNELGFYIVYRMLHNRYGSSATHLAILNRFKAAAAAQSRAAGAMFHLSAVVGLPPLDFNPLYYPLSLAYEGYRLLVCGRAPDRYNPYPVEGWTVLHEVCRLWNLTSKDYSARPGHDTWHEYRDHASGMMKLLYFLIENGVNIYVVDAHNDTPMHVLIRDNEHLLSNDVANGLRAMAGFMEATWACLNIGRMPMRTRHIDPLLTGREFDLVLPTYGDHGQGAAP